MADNDDDDVSESVSLQRRKREKKDNPPTMHACPTFHISQC